MGESVCRGMAGFRAASSAGAGQGSTSLGRHVRITNHQRQERPSSNRQSDQREASDELELSFVFVKHGDPLPNAWMAEHPDYIRIPAIMVPRGTRPPLGWSSTPAAMPGLPRSDRQEQGGGVAGTFPVFSDNEAIEAYRAGEAAFASATRSDPQRNKAALETQILDANIVAIADRTAQDDSPPASVVRGKASFYNPPPGSPTAVAGGFDPTCFCAAMFGRPGFHVGDMVRVQLQNDPTRSIDVRVNDTGPFARDANNELITPLRPHPDRVIDLTPAAMKSLLGPNYNAIGLVPVTVTRLPENGRKSK